MKYTLEPLNEGQGMNVRTIFSGNRREALKRAFFIAKTLQGLFPNSTISCQLQTRSQGLRGTMGIVAHCDGTFVDGEKGRIVKL
jgi:hypothetical protein